MSKWLELANARRGAAPVLSPSPSPVMRPQLPPPPPPPPPSFAPVRLEIPAPPPPPPGIISSQWVERAREFSGGTGPMAVADEELARILGLPVLGLDTPRCPDREGYARSLYSHIAPPDFRLRDIQIDGVYAYETYGGMFGPVSVGGGKTLISMLVGKVALQRRGHQRTLILVPPEVFSQLTLRDLPQARKWVALDGVPFWVVAGSREQRRRVVEQPGPGVFIYSYSSLSTATGMEELALIAPTQITLDEAQNVANSTAARTKRLLTLLAQVEQALRMGRLGPDVRVKDIEMVALSGTMTKRSVKDYAHIAKRCLHERSPTPIHHLGIMNLAAAIDANVTGTGMTELDAARVNMLREWAEDQGWNPRENKTVDEFNAMTAQDHVREAYQYRLRTAPGVISTGSTGVDASLIIAWSEPPRPRSDEGEALCKYMKMAAVDMKTPDGDSIDFGMHTFKWLWELTAGFYNSLIWPGMQEIQEERARKGTPITVAEAAALMRGAEHRHALLQDYHKQLRSFLDGRHQPGCDTPMLVGQELTRQLNDKEARFKLPKELIETYRAQKAATFDDLPQRKSRPIRICDYKVRGTVEWAKAHVDEGGLMWYHHPALGQWCHEYLLDAGVPHTFAPAGANEKAFTPGLVLASYAHGTGKNLQHQRHNLFVEIRREANIMEQTLGRTHRSGQKADDVRADVFVSNGFDLSLFNAVLHDADYIQSTMGQPQRLCFATYSPVIPPSDDRLMAKLGIIESYNVTPKVLAGPGDAITPPDALDMGSVFRSLAYLNPGR